MASLQCMAVFSQPSLCLAERTTRWLCLDKCKVRAQKLQARYDLRATGIALPEARRNFVCFTASQASPEPSHVPVELTDTEVCAHTLQDEKPRPFWKKFQTNGAEMRANVAKLGFAAVLAYGLLDAITYTSIFVAAFLTYEKTTGQNPAANLKALLGVVILMWTGNNFTRPFRVAGAAALAPVVDKGLRKIQKIFNLPNLAFAFMVCVATVASLCCSIVGLLIISKLGR